MVKVKNKGKNNCLKSEKIIHDERAKIKLEIITGIYSSVIEIVIDLGLFVRSGLIVMESKCVSSGTL